jgi:hypothetical protein
LMHAFDVAHPIERDARAGPPHSFCELHCRWLYDSAWK